MPMGPFAVISGDRAKGWVFFSLLFGGFCALCAYTIMDVIHLQQNPTSKVSIDDDAFVVPFFTICPPESQTISVKSYSMKTEAGKKRSDITSTDMVLQDLDKDPTKGSKTNCIRFKNTSFDCSDSINVAPQALLFYPHNTYRDNKNTWTAKKGDDRHFGQAYTYLFFSSVTQLTITKLVSTKLNEEPVTDYKVTLNSGKAYICSGANGSAPPGSHVLYLEITADSQGVVNSEEVDPLAAEILLGIFAGYFNWVILIFGLFLVNATQIDDNFSIDFWAPLPLCMRSPLRLNRDKWPLPPVGDPQWDEAMSSRSITKWSVGDVQVFLECLGLTPVVRKVFLDSEINGEVLSEMTIVTMQQVAMFTHGTKIPLLGQQLRIIDAVQSIMAGHGMPRYQGGDYMQLSTDEVSDWVGKELLAKRVSVDFLYDDVTGDVLPSLLRLSTTNPELVYEMIGEPYNGKPPFKEVQSVLRNIKSLVNGNTEVMKLSPGPRSSQILPFDGVEPNKTATGEDGGSNNGECDD